MTKNSFETSADRLLESQLDDAKAFVTKTRNAVVVVAAIVVSAYLIRFVGSSVSPDPQHWGQMGDYIGGLLNPIVGVATILILNSTLTMQMRQIELSKAQLNHQTESERRAQLENRLIDILRLWRESADRTEYVPRSGRVIKGTDSFVEAWKEYSMIDASKVPLGLTRHSFYPYFKLLGIISAQLLKHDKQSQEHFLDLVRAQMTPAEVCLTLVAAKGFSAGAEWVDTLLPHDIALAMVSEVDQQALSQLIPIDQHESA
jgi:hypothetical protein